jgi:hypothetical protein
MCLERRIGLRPALRPWEYDDEETYDEYLSLRLQDYDIEFNEKWNNFRFSLNVDFGHGDERIPLSIPGNEARSGSHLDFRTEALWEEKRWAYFGEYNVAAVTQRDPREPRGPRYVVDAGGLSRSQVLQREIDELLARRDRYNADIERLQRLHRRADPEELSSIALPRRDVTDDEEGVPSDQAIAITPPDEDAPHHAIAK